MLHLTFPYGKCINSQQRSNINFKTGDKSRRGHGHSCPLLSYALCCFLSLFVKEKAVWRNIWHYDSMVFMGDFSKGCKEAPGNVKVNPDLRHFSKCQAPNKRSRSQEELVKAQNRKDIYVNWFHNFVFVSWASASQQFKLLCTLRIDRLCSSLSHGTDFSFLRNPFSQTHFQHAGEVRSHLKTDWRSGVTF